jgi:hypothetical protein
MKIIQASNKCGQRSGKGAVLSPARCGFESVQLRFFKRHTQKQKLRVQVYIMELAEEEK